MQTQNVMPSSNNDQLDNSKAPATPYSDWLANRTKNFNMEKKAGYCLGSSDAWSAQDEKIKVLNARIAAGLACADQYMLGEFQSPEQFIESLVKVLNGEGK